MKTYEVMMIIKPNLAEDRYKELFEKLKETITSAKGEILSDENQGMKDFSQPFQGVERGYYFFVVFKADSACISKLKQWIAVTEDIFRQMIIAVDPALENAPTKSPEKA